MFPAPLPPKSEKLGSASTPSLAFRQLACLMTDSEVLRNSLFGTFQFCSHKRGKEEVSRSKGLAGYEISNSGSEEAPEEHIPAKYMLTGWVVSIRQARSGFRYLPRNQLDERVSPVVSQGS